MVKCSKSCTPTCQHCIYAECEQLEIDGNIYNGEAHMCSKHKQEINAVHYCDDFHCFRVKKAEFIGKAYGAKVYHDGFKTLTLETKDKNTFQRVLNYLSGSPTHID